jgi:hypothetical protein
MNEITEWQWLFNALIYKARKKSRKRYKSFKKRLEDHQKWFKREVKVIMNEIESLKEDVNDVLK